MSGARPIPVTETRRRARELGLGWYSAQAFERILARMDAAYIADAAEEQKRTAKG